MLALGVPELHEPSPGRTEQLEKARSESCYAKCPTCSGAAPGAASSHSRRTNASATIQVLATRCHPPNYRRRNCTMGQLDSASQANGTLAILIQRAPGPMEAAAPAHNGAPVLSVAPGAIPSREPPSCALPFGLLLLRSCRSGFLAFLLRFP